MKKLLILLLLPATVILQFCSPSKKTTATETPKIQAVTFDGQVKPLVDAKCGPCHTKGDGGLNVYANSKAHIDETIKRIALNPEDHGFMPKKNAKLSEAEIQVFVQWKATGLLEK